MITAAAHVLLAALACLVAGPAPIPVFIAAVALSLLPDIDTPRSIVGSLSPRLSAYLERRVGHRTATHSLPALALVAGAAWLVAPGHWAPLAASFASHLALDLVVGEQGVMLFWPIREWFTITAWRDDGPAPRAILGATVAAILVAAAWPALSPRAALAFPITPPEPTATARPASTVRVSFTLPAGVGMSSLLVRVGDDIAEGQALARWSLPAPTPWPTPTAPAAAPSPAAAPPPAPPIAPPSDASGARVVQESSAALLALDQRQAAERAALIAEQQRQLAAAQRQLADAQRALADLQPIHERAQAERQHAVDDAGRELAAAQAALAISPDDKRTSAEGAVRAAQATLDRALDAQARMRADQGIERAAAEGAERQAQASLDATPAEHAAALQRLDAEHAAARALALSRSQSAQSLAGDIADARRFEAQRAAATGTAAAGQWAATATSAAQVWQGGIAATAQAHARSVSATATAIPTPAPDHVISRARGRVVSITGREEAGELVVTIEIAPPYGDQP